MRWMVLAGLMTGCAQEGGFSNLVGGDGHLRFNLQFDNETNVDLDLHALTPGNDEIFYGALTDPTGGSLDVDCLCGTCPQGGNENIFWDYGGAPPPSGEYTVGVFYFGYCSVEEQVPPPTSTFTLRVLESGVEVHNEAGSLTEEGVFLLDYTYGG